MWQSVVIDADPARSAGALGRGKLASPVRWDGGDVPAQDGEIGRVKRYPCPCCGYYTLTNAPGGTFALFPVCWWEDDGVPSADPTYEGGANAPSLEQARENFLAFGANSWRERDCVRPPRPDELPPDSRASPGQGRSRADGPSSSEGGR